jgi:triacylglycerol lipase
MNELSSRPSSTSVAGQRGLPSEIAAKIAAMGAKFDGDVLAGTRALFASLVDLDVPAPGKIQDNVAYGADERQRADLYLPGGAGRPILIFVPGGGFVGGSKAGYRNIGAYFARNGFVTIIPDYRLAPAHAWPAGAADVAAVIDWAVAHAQDFGGDAKNVVMFGQSAGATHVAGALFDAKLQPKAIAAVRGAALANGIYRMTGEMRAPNLLQYFGEDQNAYAARSPITHVGNSKLPLLLMLSEYDPAFLGTPTLELAQAVYERDQKSPPLVWMKAHNHISLVFAIGSTVDEGGPLVLDFAKSLPR